MDIDLDSGDLASVPTRHLRGLSRRLQEGLGKPPPESAKAPPPRCTTPMEAVTGIGLDRSLERKYVELVGQAQAADRPGEIPKVLVPALIADKVPRATRTELLRRAMHLQRLRREATPAPARPAARAAPVGRVGRAGPPAPSLRKSVGGAPAPRTSRLLDPEAFLAPGPLLDAAAERAVLRAVDGAGPGGAGEEAIAPLVEQFGQERLAKSLRGLRGQIRREGRRIVAADPDALEKAFPIGTVRRWRSGMYRKESAGRWVQVRDPHRAGLGPQEPIRFPIRIDHLQEKAMQPWDSEEDIYDHAAAAKDALDAELIAIAREMKLRVHDKATRPDASHALRIRGGLVMLAPIKRRGRARQKAAMKGWKALSDIVRASIAVDSTHDLNRVIDALHRRGLDPVEKPTDRFGKPGRAGYMDSQITLEMRLADGFLAEVQLHLKPLLYAKEHGPGNRYYHEMRAIEARLELEGRGARPDEKARLEAAQRRSRQLFAAVWNKITGRNPD